MDLSAAHLFLFDDRTARDWLPFVLTRPAGEMLFGTDTLRGRTERATGLKCRGYLASEGLTDFEEDGAPPVASPESVPEDRDRLLLSSRLVLDGAPLSSESGLPAEPRLLVAGGASAGAWAPAGTPFPSCLGAGDYPDWPTLSVDGSMLESVWELMDKNGDRICADDRYFEPGVSSFREHPLPSGVHRIGDGPVRMGAGVDMEPAAVLDTSDGPIILAPGARVRASSRIAGPAYVGPGSTVLGGEIENSSIGPCCKIRGEMGASVVLGFANKAHEGLLGHSVVGRWVNLGAMTTVSPLKNNYGPIRTELRGRTIHTGLHKAGCLLGDQVRTAIGTLLNTGTTVEAGANLFGARMPPRYVVPFAWGAGPEPDEYDIERFLQTAEVIMARRNVKLSEGMKRLYRTAFSETAFLRAQGAAPQPASRPGGASSE